VKGRLGWVLGGVAVAGAYAWGRLRRPYAEPQAPAPPAGDAPAAPDPRADELRRRLEEAKTLVDERDVFEEGETPVDRAEPGADPGDRRRELHERARASAEEMRSD
jgi:hypothetical protein